MPSTLLQLFAKMPVPGEVKTRLIPTIGKHNATAVYQHCLQHNLQLLEDSSFDHQLWLNRYESHSLFNSHRNIHIQQGENLGDKMHHALHSGLQHYHRVILIGSDCIELTQQHLLQVDHALSQHDLVFIPARDGGYVLIAARDQITSFVFQDIHWSSEQVMQQTLQRCQQQQLLVKLLNPLRDIDHADDLQHYAELKPYLD